MKAIAGGIGVATDEEIIRAALQPAMTGREGTTAVALPQCGALISTRVSMADIVVDVSPNGILMTTR
jgi:hypothetical protein